MEHCSHISVRFQKYAAESEVLSLREQLVHLQAILESATREAAENARRSADPLLEYSLY